MMDITWDVRRLTVARADDIRSEAFADDIDMPDHRGWQEHQLHAYFESAGALRPQPFELPAEDLDFSRMCEAHGLGAVSSELLFGSSLAATAFFCHKHRRACSKWLTQRGLSSSEHAKMLNALDAVNSSGGGGNLAWRDPCVILSGAGMCNKLRVTLAHQIIAARQGRPLVVVWRAMENCPGRFADCFEPLQDVTFVDDNLPLELICEFSSSDCHPSIKGTADETRMYLNLIPRPRIRAAVDINVNVLGGPFVAVHIRRTDHHICADECGDQEFFRFLKLHATLPIFVATDNADTQKELLARFGDRVRAIKRIEANDRLRQTSLEDAVIDIFTCVQALVFKGSPYSTFSDTIHHLRIVHGTHNAVSDEHSILAPTFDEAIRRQAGLMLGGSAGAEKMREAGCLFGSED